MAEEAINLCNRIVSTGKPNFAEAKIPVKSGYNTDAFSFMLRGYPKENLIVNGVTFGWQLGWTGYPLLSGRVTLNHPTVERQYPLQTQKWINDQVDKGMLIGPISRKEIPWRNLTTHPLHSVTKDEVTGSRRMCVDGSYVAPGTPNGFGSLNQGIPKGEYMGVPVKYNLPRVRDFVDDAIKIGLNKVKGFKVDWSHAYRQNSLHPAEWWLTVLHLVDCFE